MQLRPILFASVSVIAALAASQPAFAQTNDVVPTQEKPAPKKPAPDAAAPVTATSGADTAAAPEGQEAPENAGAIIVNGFRQGIASAQKLKQNSDAIVDAIVAEDIGKLPDTFAAAALARISGVQVSRGGGEASDVRIRGLPDISTTYNGREIFTAEGRFVQIQDFPSGTVAGLEVYKSGLANLIEGGVGGQVNVRGRKPFDFKGLQISGSISGTSWEQSGATTWTGNLLVSDRWQTGIGEMGLLVNVSHNGINFTDSTREQSTVINTTNATNAPGQTAGLRFPDAVDRYNQNGKRWRDSYNGAFQWKPTPELEIYVDGLYQGYRGRSSIDYLFVPVYGTSGVFKLSNVTAREGTTGSVQSATVTGASTPYGYYASSTGDTDTYQIGGGAVWKKGGLKISADLAYTDSRYLYQGYNIDYILSSAPTLNVNYETAQNGGPNVQLVNFDMTNPANFLLRGFNQEINKTGGQDWQARTDLSYDFDGGFLRRLEAGVRFDNRDANRDHVSAYISTKNGSSLTSQRIPITALPGVTIGSVADGFVYDNSFGYVTYAGISGQSIRDNIAALRTYFGASAGYPAYTPTDHFEANEQSLAGYVQGKYGFDLGSIAVDGVVGLRAVNTRLSIDGYVRNNGVTPVTYSPINYERSYTDFLPNASMRFRFNPELQLRLAYTQTRTKPNFTDLNPTITLGSTVTTGTARSASGGNPNLQPLRSKNYDASLEWYFSRTGSLTGAVFLRDAKNFIYSATVDVEDPEYGLLRITRPENTGKTTLKGVEAAFNSFLDIDGLPKWARAFGFQGNVTYIDGMGDLSATLNASPNVTGKQQWYAGVSRWSTNAVLFYERPAFAARLAYNYRSDFVSSYSIQNLDVGDDGKARTRPLIQKARGQLDFSATVNPTKEVTISFDIANLTAAPIQRTRQYNDAGDVYTRQVIYLERTYTLGARFRF